MSETILAPAFAASDTYSSAIHFKFAQETSETKSRPQVRHQAGVSILKYAIITYSLHRYFKVTFRAFHNSSCIASRTRNASGKQAAFFI